MTRLTRAEIQEIAVALADELEARRLSRVESGALVQGDDQCDEKEGNGSMAHTNTGTDTGSS